MSRFREELKVIPTGARITAAIAYVGCMAIWILLFMFSHDQGLQSTPQAAKILLVFSPGVIISIYILLIGYVNGDACATSCGRCSPSSYPTPSASSCTSSCATHR